MHQLSLPVLLMHPTAPRWDLHYHYQACLLLFEPFRFLVSLLLELDQVAKKYKNWSWFKMQSRILFFSKSFNAELPFWISYLNPFSCKSFYNCFSWSLRDIRNTFTSSAMSIFFVSSRTAFSSRSIRNLLTAIIKLFLSIFTRFDSSGQCIYYYVIIYLF